MMNFDTCEINNIVIHDIGNKYEDGKLRLSESCFLPWMTWMFIIC